MSAVDLYARATEGFAGRVAPADTEGTVLKQTKVRGDAHRLPSGGVSGETGLDALRLVA